MPVVNNPEIIESITESNTFEDNNVETEDTSSLSAIEKPFDPRKIDIDAKVMTLDLVVKRLSSKPSEIDLYPEFQRKDDLWDTVKQSRLIESILIRIPLPAFYFDGTNDNKWLVVDGLQRLSTIRNFVITKTLKLDKMEFLTQFNACGFDSLPRDLQRRIDETQITVYIIKPGTPNLVKYNIFKRINTGGLVLEPQEIRHALNQGIPAKFVAELAQINEFKLATNNIRTERMLDRDFVTRFLSFYLVDYNDYKPDLDTFLNEAMGSIKEKTQEDRDSIKSNFKKAMITAQAIFGKHAFRKWFHINETRRKPINKALFEVWSVTLAKATDDDRRKLVSKRDILLNAFIDKMNKNSLFLDSLTSATGDKKKIIIRFSTIENLVEEILLDDQ